MIKERTRFILETAVKDFIKHGRPITSEHLYEAYDFGIKPAMIRWELNDLSENGFLTQLHHSGGRVPTDRAYRFLVDEFLSEEIGSEEISQGFDQMVKTFTKGRRKNFIEEVANYLKIMSVGYEPAGVNFYESGLDRLLSELEIDEKEELVRVVRDIESLENRLMNFELAENEPSVFIGQNQLIKSDHLSLIVENFVDRDKNFLLIAIGPKRMDYRKSLKLFRVFGNSLSNI